MRPKDSCVLMLLWGRSEEIQYVLTYRQGILEVLYKEGTIASL